MVIQDRFSIILNAYKRLLNTKKGRNTYKKFLKTCEYTPLTKYLSIQKMPIKKKIGKLLLLYFGLLVLLLAGAALMGGGGGVFSFGLSKLLNSRSRPMSEILILVSSSRFSASALNSFAFLSTISSNFAMVDSVNTSMARMSRISGLVNTE